MEDLQTGIVSLGPVPEQHCLTRIEQHHCSIDASDTSLRFAADPPSSDEDYEQEDGLYREANHHLCPWPFAADCAS